jgi:prepilin-type processing-associated H-X9-DG protein/prepilin-type N-terminal cleavage/methylation domain-containing protein
MKKYRFTLIELLIVIAIIAILASLLLPALKQARESGKKIRCAGNMKQVSVGLYQYVSDFNGYLSPASVPGSTGYSNTWTWLLKDYFNMTDKDFQSSEGTQKKYPSINAGNNVFFCSSSRFYEDVTNLQWGLSYGPTISASDEPDSYSPPKWGGFTYCRDSNAGEKLGYCEPKKINKIPQGSVIITEQYRDRYGKCCSDNGYCFPAFTNDPTSFPRVCVDYCHNNSANFLFVDGHVESMKYGSQFDNNWRVK